MAYPVYVISDAEEDLFDIYRYVSRHDSTENAEKLLSSLEDACNSLENYPERGHVPPELDRIGIKDYKEIHYKPYRIIYQVLKRGVYIHCILDGRRDMMSLLEERLLR